MAALRQSFTIRVARDRVIGLLSLGALGGAVICAGIAGGIEAAGAVAVLAARMAPGKAAGRYRELRFDGDAWTAVVADTGLAAVEPPVVHFAHRAVVVLEVSASGRSDIVLFSRASTPADDLRRLRARLRAGGLSR